MRDKYGEKKELYWHLDTERWERPSRSSRRGFVPPQKSLLIWQKRAAS